MQTLKKANISFDVSLAVAFNVKLTAFTRRWIPRILIKV